MLELTAEQVEASRQLAGPLRLVAGSPEPDAGVVAPLPQALNGYAGYSAGGFNRWLQRDVVTTRLKGAGPLSFESCLSPSLSTEPG